ncbi:MAG: GTPase HflX [Planctomycetes bacterium]|nr:GTPase HflX [Planctomycetota bacterium]
MSKNTNKDSGHCNLDEPFKVILVMTLPPNKRELMNDRIHELTGLLDTAGCRVVATCSQHLQKPVTATYIGKGKIEEICQLVEQHQADEVVFDIDLTPSQGRNLSKYIEVPIIDYSALILHIFSQNARTHQAKLAVELAQLEYHKSRLKRLWSHLDRIKAGTNMRGPGEKQLEVDRRLLTDRIRDLNEKLNDIELRKERAIDSRSDCFKVCLVGYTNAGKSSLMNALTDADVLAEDRLFATLDTRTSKLDIDRKQEIVLSDTVGFIRELPHQLIASFHATLAEVVEADLLLHVVDASIPSMEEQILAVEEVLEKVGAKDVPSIMVFNKIDREHSKTILMAFKHRFKGSVGTSAHSREGLDILCDRIRDEIDKGISLLEVRYAMVNGAVDAFLRSRATIVKEDYTEDEIVLVIQADPRLSGEVHEHPELTVREVRIDDNGDVNEVKRSSSIFG